VRRSTLDIALARIAAFAPATYIALYTMAAIGMHIAFSIASPPVLSSYAYRQPTSAFNHSCRMLPVAWRSSLPLTYHHPSQLT